MSVRTRRATEIETARGGVSFVPVLTGVVVAFGALFLLSALVGGVMIATGIEPGEIAAGEAVELGIGVGVAVLLAQLIAYLWGGYTAGRMARGAGIANGILVPIVAIVVALGVAGIAGAMGARPDLNLPFGTTRLPIQENLTIEWGLGIGLAMLALMLLGGAVGGAAGARWHHRLEREAIEAREAALPGRPAETAAPRPSEVDVTDAAEAAAANPPPPEGAEDGPSGLLRARLTSPRHEEVRRGDEPAP